MTDGLCRQTAKGVKYLGGVLDKTAKSDKYLKGHHANTAVNILSSICGTKVNNREDFCEWKKLHNICWKVSNVWIVSAESIINCRKWSHCVFLQQTRVSLVFGVNHF